MEDVSFFNGLLASDKFVNYGNIAFMLELVKYLICHDAAIDLDARRRVAALVQTLPVADFLMTVGEAVKATAERLKASPDFQREIYHVATAMRSSDSFPFFLVQRFMSAHGQRLKEWHPGHFVAFYAKVALLCREVAIWKADHSILKIVKEAQDWIVANSDTFPNCTHVYRYCFALDHCAHVDTAWN